MGGKELGNTREKKGLSVLIARLTALAGYCEKIAIHDIREEIGERSFGPSLIIPAVIEISPLGSIPGGPTAVAIIISIFAVQILFGRKHLWLPQILERQTLDGQKLKTELGKLSSISCYCEIIFRPRIKRLTAPPYLRCLAVVVMLLCVSVPPLELIPFASTVPMLAVTIVGVALLMRDGLAAGIAAVMAVGSGYLVYSALAAKLSTPSTGLGTNGANSILRVGISIKTMTYTFSVCEPEVHIRSRAM